MTEMRFTKDHEWVRLEGDVATFGISEHAQAQLGDVVFVDLPPLNKTIVQGSDIAVVESVKAASEVYAPLSGQIIAINEALSDDPGLINRDSEGEGWFAKIRISDVSEWDSLMSRESYVDFSKHS